MANPTPLLLLLLFATITLFSSPASAHDAASCPFSSSSGDPHHGHEHRQSQAWMLPEELAEEADLEMERLLNHDHHHFGNHESASLGVWMTAMGCSLLVSLASLICIILLPVIFMKGKPSKTVVDALATFGAGAMLGDAFLHQLPHAFGGEHSHSHDHDTHHDATPSHSHSLQDLSVGLSVLSGIVLFLLVEKVVRYIDDVSGKGASTVGHGHNHLHHKRQNKVKDEDADDSIKASELASAKLDNKIDSKKVKKQSKKDPRKRTNLDSTTDSEGLDATDVVKKFTPSIEAPVSSPSSLVFGYLNLFSDGVHNFTDGMALGSAFLLYGSVGGWSRTLFLLAHELPQEIGDFGILVRSGFTASKALFFNFLSALVALLGTALALLLGKDPGHSSLIEGFTAGGFIYIAVAGVLPELNNGSTSLKNTGIQLTSLILGMGVALAISLAE